MNNMPFFVYLIWAVIGPFLLIYLTNNQRNTGNPVLVVVVYLVSTIVGVMAFYELLDLRKEESLIDFYRRKQEEKKTEEEQQRERMKLLAKVRFPSFCCRCGKKIDNKLEWEILLADKSLIDYLLILLNKLHILSYKDQEPKIPIHIKICSDCFEALSLSRKILVYSQPTIMVLFLLMGVIYGIINSAIVLFVVLGIIVGLLINAVVGGIVNWIANTDFYKIDWKYRSITFTNKKFQKEFKKLNSQYSIDS